MNQDAQKDSSGDPAEISADAGNPKFGRLLLVLFLAVMAVVAITFASEAFYS